MSQVDKVRKLIALAVNAGAASEEARNAALAACRLIHQHSLTLSESSEFSEAASPPSSRSSRPPPEPRAPKSRPARRSEEPSADWDSFMADFFSRYDWGPMDSAATRRRVKVRIKCACSYCGLDIEPGEYAYEKERTSDRLCASCEQDGLGSEMEDSVL